jgi:DHA1 family bicyclomycin/chloramphenicol resistance-like MFS transporter
MLGHVAIVEGRSEPARRSRCGSGQCLDAAVPGGKDAGVTLPPPGPAHAPTPARAHAGDREFLGLIAGCMGMAAVGIDLLLPAFGDMRRAFGLAPDATDVTRLITAFFIGLALGQFVYGPLSDRFGRKRLLFAGLGLYCACAAAASFAPSLEVLVAIRFVWGLGAAGPRSLAVAMVRDRFEGEQMARTMSMVMAIFITVPVVAPAIGAGVMAVFGWRAVFWFQFLLAGLVMLWAALRLPETLPIEHRRAVHPRALLDALTTVVRTRQSLAFGLSVLFLFGVLSSYIGSSEIILDDVFGQGDAFPYLFGALALVMGAGSLLNARFVVRVGVERFVRFAVLGAVCGTGTFALVAFVTDGRPPLAVFLVLTAVMLFGNSMLVPNANTLAMAPVPHVAGMASAVIGALGTGGGALVGSLIDTAFDGTIRPFAYGGFVCTVLAALCVFVLAARPTPRNVSPHLPPEGDLTRRGRFGEGPQSRTSSNG